MLQPERIARNTDSTKKEEEKKMKSRKIKSAGKR